MTARRKKLLLALAALVLACLVGEAAMRVRFYTKYGTFLRVHTFATDPATGLEIPVPLRDTGAIKIDSRGFRNPEIEVPKPPRRVRLAFLGGSTTYCAEVSSNDATWPALVARELAAKHAGVTFDYVNAGVPGYKVADLQTTLGARVAPLAPDVIVVYEATNDLTKDTRLLAQAQGVYVEHADRDHWLAEISLLWHVLEKNVLVRSRAKDAHQATGRLALDVPAIAGPFRTRMEGLLADAKSRASVVAVATFAQRLRREQTPAERAAACVTHFYYMPYISEDALFAGFDGYNAAIRDAARASGVVLVEGEDAIPGDAIHFADSVHFTDAGAKLQAERVTRALEASSAFQELVRAKAAE